MDERALREQLEQLPGRIAAARAELEHLRTDAAHEAERRALRDRLARARAQREELRSLCRVGEDLRSRIDRHVAVEYPVWKRRLAAARLGPPAEPVEALPVAPPGIALRLVSTGQALGLAVAMVTGVLVALWAACLVLGWFFP